MCIQTQNGYADWELRTPKTVTKQVHVCAHKSKTATPTGNYDPRNLLVGSLFLLQITSLSKSLLRRGYGILPNPKIKIKSKPVNGNVHPWVTSEYFKSRLLDELRSRSVDTGVTEQTWVNGVAWCKFCSQVRFRNESRSRRNGSSR